MLTSSRSAFKRGRDLSLHLSLAVGGDLSIGPVVGPSRKVAGSNAEGGGVTGTGLGFVGLHPVLGRQLSRYRWRAERLPGMHGLKAAGCQAGELSGPYRA